MVNKKGFMFTLTSLLFVFLFSLIIFSYYDLTQNSGDFSVRSQAQVYQSYYESIKDTYIPLVIEISSRDAMDSLINFTISEQMYVPLSELNIIFADLLKNGTSNVTYTGSLETISLNKGLNYSLASQIDEVLSSYDSSVLFQSAEINITPLWSNVQINQSTPWDFEISLPFSLELTHEDFTFSDDYVLYKISVSIEDLSDPLFGVEADYANFDRPIKNSTFVLNQWTSNLLELFALNNTYVKDPEGTSFIMRLTNSTNQITPASSNIISFINPYYLNDSLDPLYSYLNDAKTKSFRDDLFFTDLYENCDNGIDQSDYLYNITKIVNETNLNFRLDFDSTVAYLGTDFSDSDEFSVSCSQNIGP